MKRTAIILLVLSLVCTMLAELETPFIICGKRIKQGGIIDEPMMQYDTAATIAHIFGLVPPRCWIGRPALSAFK